MHRWHVEVEDTTACVDLLLRGTDVKTSAISPASLHLKYAEVDGIIACSSCGKPISKLYSLAGGNVFTRCRSQWYHCTDLIYIGYLMLGISTDQRLNDLGSPSTVSIFLHLRICLSAGDFAFLCVGLSVFGWFVRRHARQAWYLIFARRLRCTVSFVLRGTVVLGGRCEELTGR